MGAHFETVLSPLCLIYLLNNKCDFFKGNIQNNERGNCLYLSRGSVSIWGLKIRDCT